MIGKPSTILFAAHDPGGANVIRPLIEHYAGLPGWRAVLVLLGPAAERIIITGAEYVVLASYPTPGFPNELSVNEAEIQNILERTKPDIVFTATSFNSNLERLVVRIAKEHHIPTFAILDYWSNYEQRFTYHSQTVYPDSIFVADATMQRECEEAVQGTAKVIISGNPHLQKLAGEIAQQRTTKPSGKPASRLRFFSENIHHYYPHKAVNELTIVKDLFGYLQEYDWHGELRIRPHPMESRGVWESLLSEYHDCTDKIHLEIDTMPFQKVLQDDCIAVGLTSMALLETAVCGIPTFSYQINVPRNDGYFLLPFEDYGITQLRDVAAIPKMLQAIATTAVPVIANIGFQVIDTTLVEYIRSS